MESPKGIVELAHLVRNGFVESKHFGSLLIRTKDGTPLISLGDPTAPIFPRSAVKPFQAIAMVRHGLDLPDHLLAFICGESLRQPCSHSWCKSDIGESWLI